jgi:hypothetical protein
MLAYWVANCLCLGRIAVTSTKAYGFSLALVTNGVSILHTNQLY